MALGQKWEKGENPYPNVLQDKIKLITSKVRIIAKDI